MDVHQIHETALRAVINLVSDESPLTIHEGVIRDIVDVVSDTSKSEVILGMLNKNKSFKSVADATSNLTLVFPVVASTNIKIENSAMVCKAIERKTVAMMQMLFSAIQISDSKNAVDYLRNFHTNLKYDNDVSVDNLLDTFDRNFVQREGVTITDHELYKRAIDDFKNLNHYLPEAVSECGLNAYKIMEDISYGDNGIIKEALFRGQDQEYDPYSKRKNSSQPLSFKDQVETLNKQVMPTDIKKANELVPTLITINFISTATDKPIQTQVVIGIKAKLYPVDSIDIINRIKSKHKDNNGFNNFIRATTREISFWKDFIFAVDKAKIDALSSSNRGSSSKIWKLLERRALKSKVRRTLGQSNDATAITTLIISQEEVEYMKKTENIDLSKSNVAKPILDTFNLMGIVIIDEAMEVSKFLFDSEDEFENLSFNYLERESSDNQMKKVINLMTKVAR